VIQFPSSRSLLIWLAIRDTAHILEQLDLLAEGSLPLIQACQKGIATSIKWLLTANRDRHIIPLPVRKATKVEEKAAKDSVEEVTANLQSQLNDYHRARLAVVKPYGHIFDPAHPPSDGADYRKVSTLRHSADLSCTTEACFRALCCSSTS
jgi:hypothetical protein